MVDLDDDARMRALEAKRHDESVRFSRPNRWHYPPEGRTAPFAPLHPGFNHNRHVILTSFFSQTIKISA